jgi:hypothetical protein
MGIGRSDDVARGADGAVWNHQATSGPAAWHSLGGRVTR